MERSEVKELLKTIDIYYPNFVTDQPKVKLDAWELILKKYDNELVMANFIEHVETSTYPPKIAELVKKPMEAPRTIRDAEQTRAYLKQFDGPPKTSPEEAQKFLDEIARILGIQKAGESNE